MFLDRDATLPAAIVVGVDLNGLGVLRSLGRARVTCVALDTDLSKPTARTRYGSKIRFGALSGTGFVDELMALRSRFRTNPVLFLTQEPSVATVSSEYERLSGAFRISLPSVATMTTLLDKVLFQAEAEKYGCPIPRAFRLKTGSSEVIPSDLRFPCVLKPTTKNPAYEEQFKKAYRVRDAHEIASLWQDMQRVIDEAIVQEWIEGTDSDVYFCLQYRGRNQRTSFVGRKLLQWPPLVGGTASCTSAPECADELTALTDAFFDSVGMVGICSMEYKRDRRDGRYYMVEPTVGRTDHQEEIATLNGVNIPLAAYFGEQGQPAPSSFRVDPPREWRDPIACYRVREATGDVEDADSMPPGEIIDAYFRWYDPRPFVHMRIVEPIARRLAGITKPRADA
jgi:predicted ATP-grasp superfamily ATP-dependent carboligase